MRYEHNEDEKVIPGYNF
jgi:hypothetical protein